MTNPINFLYVFLGGGLGACFRYSLSILTIHLSPKAWMATLLANIIGCVLIFLGMRFRFFELGANQFLLKIGLLGGLTTFSTFSLEIVQSLKSGDLKEAFLIFSLNIIFGIAIGIGILR